MQNDAAMADSTRTDLVVATTAMPTIEIDEEVFELLQKVAEPLVDTPNTAIRRLLGIDSVAVTTPRTATRSPRKRMKSSSKVGELAALLNTGDIALDDELVYRKRSGEIFRGYVTNHGWIVVEGTAFPTPSAALKSVVGYEVNGWKLWTHERSGKTLDAFRK